MSDDNIPYQNPIRRVPHATGLCGGLCPLCDLPPGKPAPQERGQKTSTVHGPAPEFIEPRDPKVFYNADGSVDYDATMEEARKVAEKSRQYDVRMRERTEARCAERQEAEYRASLRAFRRFLFKSAWVALVVWVVLWLARH